MRKTAIRTLGALISMVMVGSLMMANSAAAKGPAKADLSISMTDSPDPARAGSTVHYTITASNLGPSGATGAKVTDTPPAEGYVVAASADQGSCTIGAEVTCALGSLASGASVRVVVEVRYNQAGTFVNTAAVSAQESDPSRSNNSTSASTQVLSSYSCCSVTVVDTPDPATAGEVIVYEVDASATGGFAVMSGTEIVVRLPEGTEFVGATNFSCCTMISASCSYADRTVLCRGGTKPQAKIVLRPLRSGELKVVVDLFIRGGSLVASSTAVTAVAPARAPGADTPAPAHDSIEKGQEDASAAVNSVRDRALGIVAEAPSRVERLKEELLMILCRLTCFKW